MRAILLCPGPSVARCYAGDEAELVVAVNRAALAYPCHVWAALDPPIVHKCGPELAGCLDPADRIVGKPPRLLTSADTPRILARDGWRWPADVVVHRDLLDYLPHEINYCLYTATTALVFAARHGATSIDVYGADWKGTQDYDGVVGGTNRTPARWDSERLIWCRTVEELQRRGVTINRYIA